MLATFQHCTPAEQPADVEEPDTEAGVEKVESIETVKIGAISLPAVPRPWVKLQAPWK